MTLAEHAVLHDGRDEWLLALADVQDEGAAAERYFVPLAAAFEDDDEERARALAAVAASKARQQARMGVLADATADEPFCRALVRALAAGRTVKGEGGEVVFRPARRCAEVLGDALEGPLPLQRLPLSQHAVAVLGERLFLKTYRQLQPGPAAEAEMARHLSDVLHFANAVPLAGSVEFHGARGGTWTLALVQARVVHQGDAHAYTVEQLARVLETADGVPLQDQDIEAPVERFALLARRVAQLHAALARRTGDAAFDPEPVTSADLQRWAARVDALCAGVLDALAVRSGGWPAPLAAAAGQVQRLRDAFGAILRSAASSSPAGLKTRLHADLALGQVLMVRDDFVFIDFEGDPAQRADERRAKDSPLRDLAALLASLDDARQQALRQVARLPAETERLAPVARRWERRVRAAMIEHYFQAADELPGPARPLLALFELERALQQLHRQLDQAPDGLAQPLAALALIAGEG